MMSGIGDENSVVGCGGVGGGGGGGHMQTNANDKIYTVPTMKNYDQLFVNGPQLTRKILKRMKTNEFGKKTMKIFGYEMRTCRLLVISSFTILFFLGLVGTIVMWFTTMFDHAIYSQLVLSNNTQAFELWRRPTPKPLMKVYIFNYTNVEAYRRGNATKLRVQQLGPYVYEETMERINSQFDNNGSQLTYQEKRVYRFDPIASKGRRQSDQILIPNLPLFAASAQNRHANFLARLAVAGVLNGLNAKPFVTLAAHRFITGYEDSLYNLGKNMMKWRNEEMSEQIGLLSRKAGIQSHVMTINTGANDINRLGVIESIDRHHSLNYWSTPACNAFGQSTDGTLYPPLQVRAKRPLSFFVKDFCRTMPLVYERDVTILDGKIPAYRYYLPNDIYDTPDNTPANQCYCDMDSGACAPRGLFNVTLCAQGAPAFMSLPHLRGADESIRHGVDGLDHTTNATYQSFVDLHPTLGFAMAGRTYFQLNLQVIKAVGINQMDMFDDGTILPIAWFDMSLEDKQLPEDIVAIIFQTTFTVKSVETCLKYGSLMTLTLTTIMLLLVLRRKDEPISRSRCSTRTFGTEC